LNEQTKRVDRINLYLVFGLGTILSVSLAANIIQQFLFAKHDWRLIVLFLLTLTAWACMFRLSVRENLMRPFVRGFLLLIMAVTPFCLIGFAVRPLTGVYGYYLIISAYIWFNLPLPYGAVYPLFMLLLFFARFFSPSVYRPVVVLSTVILPSSPAAVAVLTSQIFLGLLAWNRICRINDEAELAEHRDTAAKFAEANVRLQDYAARVEGMAKTEERTRMARDMHDILAHALTSMIVQIGACERMISVDPERAAAELVQVREAARQGLAEVRVTISALRATLGEGEKGREMWAKLAKAFAEVTGMKIRFIVEQDFDVIDDELNEVVYRVVQEGLTNAYRHGQATDVDVTIWWDKGLLMVKISDNGRGAENIDGGYGLVGMRERVEALGGSIAWRSKGGRGFDLGVQIPVRGGEET